MQVTFISYLVGTLASLGVCVFAQYPLPTLPSLSQTSWWMWIGGSLGTLYVWSTIFATPKIGAALALGLTIAGQMLAALFLDHYGALGDHVVNGQKTTLRLKSFPNIDYRH
jgi:transporter family-2 protein